MFSYVLKVPWYCASFGVPVPEATVLSFINCEVKNVAMSHGDTGLTETRLF